MRPLWSTMVTEIQSGKSGATSRGRDGGFRTKRVEDRLDEQDVDAAFGQRRDLPGIRGADPVERQIWRTSVTEQPRDARTGRGTL